MRYLKITIVRIVLSFFAGSMAKELIIANTNRESVSVIFTIIFMGLFYFGLTLYVNNRR